MICLKMHLKAKNTFGGSPEPPEMSGGAHVGQTWIVSKGLIMFQLHTNCFFIFNFHHGLLSITDLL